MNSTVEDDSAWFEAEKQFHEQLYLAGRNPRQQSGFGRDERDRERFRRPVAAAIRKSGTFLDIGCANGLLMEDVRRWAMQDGYTIEPYGLDISQKLVTLARERLPHWRDRIFTGNALYWDPPFRFDYVRTELVYVPTHRRREYLERLLSHVVAPEGFAILCAYGSSRPEGMIHCRELLISQDGCRLNADRSSGRHEHAASATITRAPLTVTNVSASAALTPNNRLDSHRVRPSAATMPQTTPMILIGKCRARAVDEHQHSFTRVHTEA